MAKDINELIANRKDWVVSSKANNFESGIKNLLSNMYPDEAHFIYELLQNAEDKKATAVYFKMQKDKLIFEHNGGVVDKSQLFTLKDIESITGIGASTKKDDNTAIGKFGVGFKAVFAYTESPQIYSGEYSFEINDLVVPTIIKPANDLKYGITRFVFPFNSKTKSLEDILFEVRRGLVNIKDNTLLFLKNIETIEYELYDGTKGAFVRDAGENNRVTLLNQNNEETYWLRFDKNIQIEDEEDAKIKNCTINIAFKLNKIDLKMYEIVPTDAGISIFFPAEKEVSNLRFVINAPFASTIARDSVRNCKSNRLLIEELAIFIKEVLKKIKDYGYMKMSFLKVLPNNDDKIPELYNPIVDSIYEEYRHQPYFITQSNELDFLCNVRKAYRAKVYELFSNDDINTIFNKKGLKWLKNPQQNSSLEYKFLEVFPIDVVSAYQLICKNGKIFCDIARSKDVRWCRELLKYLSDEAYSLPVDFDWERLGSLEFLPTAAGTYASPNRCFYSLNNSDCDKSILVNKEIYNDNKKNIIIATLKDLGVYEYNINSQICAILKKYQGNFSIEIEDNVNDVIKIVNLASGKSLDWETEQLIKDTPFIYGTDDYFNYLYDLILSRPYCETSFYALLETKIKIKDLNKIEDVYLKDEKFNAKFNDFCLKYGAISDIKLICIGGRGRIGENYDILHLDEILKTKDISLALMLWNFLKKENLTMYCKHKKSGELCDSDLIVKLKKYSWLPDKNNIFFKPEEIFIEDLPKEFSPMGADILIDILGIKSRNKDRKKLQEALNESYIGMPISDLNAFEGFRKDNPDKYKEFLAYINKKNSQPYDEERRKQKNIEEAQNAPLIASDQKVRTVRTPESVVNATAYLKNWYHDEEVDIIRCQICHEMMPFRKKDNNWYFEDVEMFKKNIVCKADASAHLLLCPICSAKYKEYFKNDEVKQIELIKEIISGKEKLLISLDVEAKLLFARKHLKDLRDKLPYLLDDSIKDKVDILNIEPSPIENVVEEEGLYEVVSDVFDRNLKKKKYSLAQITESFYNVSWVYINKDGIQKIAYSNLRKVMFIRFSEKILYFEEVTKDEYDAFMNAQNKKEYVEQLKKKLYYNFYNQI